MVWKAPSKKTYSLSLALSTRVIFFLRGLWNITSHSQLRIRLPHAIKGVIFPGSDLVRPQIYS